MPQVKSMAVRGIFAKRFSTVSVRLMYVMLYVCTVPGTCTADITFTISDFSRSQMKLFSTYINKGEIVKHVQK